MTDTPAIVRGQVALTCNPWNPDSLNAAIAAVRAEVEATYGAGQWEASHSPAGFEIVDAENPDAAPKASAGNVLSWTYYPTGAGA